MQPSKLALFLVALCSIINSSAIPEQNGATTNSLTSCQQFKEEDAVCPTWFLPKCDNGSLICECNDKHVELGRTVVKCPSTNKISPFHSLTEDNKNHFNISILAAYCLSFNTETKETLLAICPYNDQSSGLDSFYVTFPSNISDLNNFMCSPSNRKGEFCQRCIEGFGPSIYSLNYNCISIKNHPFLWFRFLASVVLTHVIILVAILICNLHATRGPLNAYICICQIISGVIVIESNILLCSMCTLKKAHHLWRS